MASVLAEQIRLTPPSPFETLEIIVNTWPTSRWLSECLATRNEINALIQTNKIGKFPIVLVGKTYWKGLIDWVTDVLLDKASNISKEDLKLINIVENPAEAVEIIERFYNKYTLKPNF